VKLFFSILFSIFYLTSTSGITVNTHYCGGKIKHISFFKHSEKNCCGKKKMSKNCCKDKAAYFKVKDNHQSSDLLKSPLPSSKISVFALPVFEYSFLTTNLNRRVLNYHAPPVLYDNPLYLKHKVLLI
jgi:hypothetical protein